MREHPQTAEGVSIIIGRHSKTQARLTDNGLPSNIRRGGQRNVGTKSRQRTTIRVLCQSHAPCGRDKLPDDRKGGTSAGSDRKTYATVFSKPHHNGKNQLPCL